MELLREVAEALVDATGGPGDPDRRRVVIGRDFPFLKKGTLTSSVADIVVSEQQAVVYQLNFVRQLDFCQHWFSHHVGFVITLICHH